MPTRTVASVLLLTCACAAPRPGLPPPPAPQLPEATALLSRYVQIDTSNPPGGETAAARFLAEVLAAHQIEATILESSPGRGNLHAVLRGDGSARPLVLLHHLDVVPAAGEGWSVPPFSGRVQDGHLWGRGALDVKGLGVMHLLALLRLKAEKVPLTRDVILLATADEESGGSQGLGFLFEQHPGLLKDVELVWTEGAYAYRHRGAWVHGIEVAQKTPLWIEVSASGKPGHAAAATSPTAPQRLIAALSRLSSFEPPLKLLPLISEYYAAVASLEPPGERQPLLDLARALQDPEFARSFTSDPVRNAALRNTLAITQLKGSPKENVVPARATATLDLRLLPGEDPARVVAELRSLIDDPSIELTTKLGWPSADPSPRGGPLYDALAAQIRRGDPQAHLTPVLLLGFSDCHHFRARKISCYGYLPARLEDRDLAGYHGLDERISLHNLEQGVAFTYELVKAVATSR